MPLVYLGSVGAASDATMATVTNTVNSQFRGALMALLQAQAAAIIAADPTLIAATRALVEIALAENPLVPRKALDGTMWAVVDSRRRQPLAVMEPSGVVSAPLGVVTPFAGEPVPDQSGYLWGIFDPIRRRYLDGTLGPDGRFIQETIDSIAERIAEGGGSSGDVRQSAPLALTCAAGGSVVDTEPARTVRYPVKVPARASRFRVHIANRNDRQGTLYPGALSVSGLWWGEAARTGGELNGATTAVPTQLRGAFTTPATGSEWVSEWFDRPIPVGVDHILSIGYTNAAGQTNHAGQGGAWVSTNPADASAMAPAVSRVQTAPLDVWLECEISGKVLLIACLGDSLTAGTAATLPVHDSWPMVFAGLQEVWPVHFAHHGSNMDGWATGDEWRWSKYGAIKIAAVIWALGSNDIFGGATLSTAKARFETLHAKVSNALSSRIILATIMPRNNSTPETEAVRVAYNAWLYQRPMGAVGVVDFAKSIESTIGTVRADYIAGDGTHLTTAGYAQNALAIPGPMAH